MPEQRAALILVLALILPAALRFGGPSPPPAAHLGAARALSPPRDAAAAAALLYGHALDLNAATETDLEALPRIGPSRARAIIEARNARGGRFDAVEDLLDVPGIGPRTLERLRPHVTVSSLSPPTPPAVPAERGSPPETASPRR